MQRRNSGRLRAGVSLFAALLAVGSSAPSAAEAVSTAPGQELSPRLAALAKPALRAAPPGLQAKRLSLAPEGPGSLLRRGEGIVTYVRFQGSAAAVAGHLRAAGAQVLHISDEYRTITAAVRPTDLNRVSAVAGVAAMREVLTPIVAATCGSTISEGDDQLRAEQAREAFSLDGSGVTVGILSDSFDTDPLAVTHAVQDIASGDLPGPGNPCGRQSPTALLEDYAAKGPFEAEQIDEGRAMAQIVHDIAPGASLAFATAFTGEFEFADNIRRLAAPPAAGGAGADVIIDDVIYFDDPFFQRGPIGIAVDDVAQQGVAYFSSAGNNNLIDAEGNDIASWEAPAFRDAECPAELKAAAETLTCMDFDPAPAEEDPTFGITVEPEAVLTVNLQWAEPWEGVVTDLDVYLLGEDGKPLPPGLNCGLPVMGSCDNNVGHPDPAEERPGTQRPVESFSWENESNEPQEVSLVINRCFDILPVECNPDASSTSMPRLKFALLQNGGGVSDVEYDESAGGDTVGPTIFGHNGDPSAISVAAVPYFNSGEPEPYSSRGPRLHLFGPASGTTPAPPLSPPQSIAKPDLAATDCGVTTFFFPEGPGESRFCGTSAAAPHAAAVAALMRQANPALSLADLRSGLAASAQAVGSFGPDAVGAGLVDAVGAVGRVALPPQVTITEPPPALTRDATPSIGFASSRPVTFLCSIDGAAPQQCRPPFTPAARLRDGTHGFQVLGIDIAGLTGQSAVASFRIDTRAPRAFFRKRPRKRIRTRKRRLRAVFRFGSNERRVTFLCRVDRARFRPCRAKVARRLRPGRHVVRLKARDLAGNVTRRPTVYRFRIGRVRGG